MNKLKWTFDLTQHTPMIHFQSSDDSVCLRATEVKPKFDRFLLEKECFTDDQKKEWFYAAEDGRLASKMKLRFRTKGKIVRRRENYVKTVFFKDGVKGTVLCFSGEFLEIVKRHIPVFFLLNNFGARQNKGFGSFSVAGGEVGGSICDVIREHEQNAFCLDYNVQGRRWDIPAEERLDDIGILYGLMKDGIDNKGKKLGHKGAIFRYYQDKGIINEKKVVKQYLFDGKSIKDIKKAYYVGVVLGLTKRFSYKDTMVSVSNNAIERYQSPVYFKVLDRYTFLFLRPMPEALRGAKFKFSRKVREIKKGKEIIKVKKINLTVPDLDIEDFMDWFAEDFNNKEQIEDLSTGDWVRGSLKAEDNDKFTRIEQLRLRRCGG